MGIIVLGSLGIMIFQNLDTPYTSMRGWDGGYLFHGSSCFGVRIYHTSWKLLEKALRTCNSCHLVSTSE